MLRPEPGPTLHPDEALRSSDRAILMLSKHASLFKHCSTGRGEKAHAA